MLNVGDLLHETRKDLMIDPLSIRLQGRAFVLLGDDRDFCTFSLFEIGKRYPFFQTLTHIYHLGLEERKEVTIVPLTGAIV